MHGRQFKPLIAGFIILPMMLSGCATTTATQSGPRSASSAGYSEAEYAKRLPQNISMGKEKVILVDPKHYAWGAYEPDGKLVKAGIATSGGDTCEDEVGPCRTSTGTYRIQSMQGEECYSKKYPKPEGGGLMPYCMFFHGGQALHGSPDYIVVENNISHGCVRMRIADAEWLYSNFAKVGTKVVVLPYN